MDRKIFTLEEANRLVPRISSLFSEIFNINARIKSLSKDIEGLLEIWGEAVMRIGHQDNAFYVERVEKKNKAIDELKRRIEAIQSVGCIVKNIEQGLIDFVHDNGEDVIFLCWKYGEDSIRHWHGLQDGYVGRRPLHELQMRRDLTT